MVKINSIDDVFVRESVNRDLYKERVKQSKARKIIEKRNKPAYYLSLYRKTGDIRFYNMGIALKEKYNQIKHT